MRAHAWRKTLGARREPTPNTAHMAPGGDQTQATLLRGEHSPLHHPCSPLCTIRDFKFPHARGTLAIEIYKYDGTHHLNHVLRTRNALKPKDPPRRTLIYAVKGFLEYVNKIVPLCMLIRR